ncbi:MAG: RDD family protein [Myxococcaceae bacterium]|nr:RDD family protein [Myxococcaceae bacterium]
MAHTLPAGTLDGSHTVLTPEYVEFDFVLAGLYSRFLAWLIDGVIVVAISAAVITLIGVASIALPGFGSALIFIVYFLIDWGYAIFLETIWSGQTIGKRAMGLRVIQESGVRIGIYQAALRNLIRPFDRLPLFYLVGGIAALFSASHQRLGDMVAGTIVVRERRLKIPSSVTQPEGETTLLKDARFIARAMKLPSEDQEVLFNAAIRREELGMDARLGLFAALSRRLQEEYGFDKPEHLSDEKLVLLVAAAIANEKAKPRKAKKVPVAPLVHRAG